MLQVGILLNNLDYLWQEALEALKSEVSSVSFQNFIQPVQPISYENHLLRLRVNNPISMQIIQNKYLSIVEAVLYKLTGESIQVEVNLENGQVPIKSIPKQSQQSCARLNPNYTFDTFVVGKSNEFAHAGALAVAELPGQTYNPLFIYGGPGLGKTHIMHAIGNFICQDNPEANVMYVTSENFTNELIYALKTGTMVEFKNKYRKCDLLLIDDIQFISGKESTHEEFFHTFENLQQSGKQIVISSDKPPREIRDIDERLRSRFEWGLIADIQKPDYETRVAILQKKVEYDNLVVPLEVINYIADVIQSNIRELEGSLSRIQAYSKLHNCPVTIDMTKEAFKGAYGETKPKIITSTKIKETVCQFMEISMADLISQKRNREIAYPRQVAMYLVRTMTNLSYPAIGEEFGGKDHTTILHAVKQMEIKMQEDEQTRTLVEDIANMIKQ